MTVPGVGKVMPVPANIRSSIAIRVKGFAMAVMSLVGSSPDIYLPLIDGAVLGRLRGKPGCSMRSGLLLMLWFLLRLPMANDEMRMLSDPFGSGFPK